MPDKLSIIVLFSTVFFILFIFVIILAKKPCRKHKWPKQRVPITEWSTNLQKHVPTGRWKDTNKDEWLPDVFSGILFRRCRCCGAYEVKIIRDGQETIVTYDMYGKVIRSRPVDSDISIESTAWPMTDLLEKKE